MLPANAQAAETMRIPASSAVLSRPTADLTPHFAAAAAAAAAVLLLSCRYETIKAADAVAALKASLKPVATAKRDGSWKNLDAKELVPGDMVLLGAGSAIPAGEFCLCVWEGRRV
jgi:magnesium-transporting ATPase (P-type)